MPLKWVFRHKRVWQKSFLAIGSNTEQWAGEMTGQRKSTLHSQFITSGVSGFLAKCINMIWLIRMFGCSGGVKNAKQYLLTNRSIQMENAGGTRARTMRSLKKRKSSSGSLKLQNTRMNFLRERTDWIGLTMSKLPRRTGLVGVKELILITKLLGANTR